MKTNLPEYQKVQVRKYESVFSSQLFLPVLLIAMFIMGIQLPIVLGVAAMLVFILLAKKTYNI